MMEHVNYFEGMDFSQYPAGTEIRQVPVNHEMFNAVKAYLKPRKLKKAFTDKYMEITRNWNAEKFHPLYYCQNCHRIEDGANRFHAWTSDYFKGQFLNIKLAEICYKKITDSGFNVYCMFSNALKNAGINGKDPAWLYANEHSKWNYLNELDFKGKTVLDVGTQCGYTLFKAVQRGASEAIGVEIRPEMTELIHSLIAKFDLREKIDVYCHDFRIFTPPGKFNFVFCMGLLHYFSLEEYEPMFDKLVSFTNDYLIIELRTCMGKGFFTRKGQTFASFEWLHKKAEANNLEVVKSITRDHERTIWIFRKK